MDELPLIQQYLKLRSEFMGYLYAITRDAELAEEVYQNAAVVVMEQSQKSTEEIRSFRSWAKEVVRRQALHAIRTRENSSKLGRPMAPELLEAVCTVFIEDDSQDSIVEQEAKALKLCLDGLPEDKREMLAMRYESSSSFADISDKMDSTPAAIQRALSRVRRSLQSCVEKRLRLAEGA